MSGDSGQNKLEGEADLVLIALPGVQQFISETRSVGDVRAASEIYSRLTAEVARACGAAGQVIFPAQFADAQGLPNRVVALFPVGAWPKIAKTVTQRVKKTWQSWVKDALELNDQQVSETPGMPQVQWVAVPPVPGGYLEQWTRAQSLMAARRLVCDFPPVEWKQRTLCGVGPRWPAERPPASAKKHEQVPLSAAAWVKRRWTRINNLSGFASTWSIASAPYRQAVLDHLGEPEVRAAVAALSQIAREVIKITQDGDVRESPLAALAAHPGQAGEPGRWFASTGGPWVYEDRWQAESLARENKAGAAALAPLVRRGRDAARRLAEIMLARGVGKPASHLAAIVADLDDFGKFLSGQADSADGEQPEVSVYWHRQVSASLRQTGLDQRQRLEDAAVLGLPVYAGGDDLLAFVPARHALAAAKSCHDLVSSGLRRPSTGVCFFHCHASLRDALTSARELLQAAKGLDGKHGLGVGYLRRSGASEMSVQPWEAGGAETIGAYGVFAGSRQYRLSPGLLADLDKDSAELARLSADWPDIYRAELTRLVTRHLDGNPPKAEVKVAAEAIAGLGEHEALRPREIPAAAAWPLPAARVAVFLRQEAR